MYNLLENMDRDGLKPHYVEEDNSTGTVQGSEEYNIPDTYDDKLDEIFSSISRTISEVTYKDFRNDSTSSEKQKINRHITEINAKLREVEQMVSHASRLKLESGSDQTVFWKSTASKFGKITERLNRINTKIREFNS